MKDDRKKYEPDVARVLEEYRPERVRERRRKALAKLVEEGLVAESTPPPAPDEARPVTKPTGTAGRQWPRSWKLVAGFALVAVSAPALSALLGRTKEPQTNVAASATATATAAPLPSTMPSPSPEAIAPPSATAMPSATPAPSAEPSPKPTSPPAKPQRLPRKPKPKPKTETATQAPPEPPLSPKFAE